jgi:hypothetical protein
MKQGSPQLETKPESYLSKSLGHSALRFIIAGFVAFIIAFALLFFMRYLILGYDKFASEEITRYLSIKTISRSSTKIELPPIERPVKPSYRPDLDESDFQHNIESSTGEQDTQTSIDEAMIYQLEDNIQMPVEEDSLLSTQEKMKLIKQELLSDDG